MATCDFHFIYNDPFPSFPCHRELVSKLKRAPVLSHNPFSMPCGSSIAIQRSGLASLHIPIHISLRGYIKRRRAAISVELRNCIYKNQILNSRPEPETAGSKGSQEIDDVPNVKVPVAGHETTHKTLNAPVLENNVASGRVKSFVW